MKGTMPKKVNTENDVLDGAADELDAEESGPVGLAGYRKAVLAVVGAVVAVLATQGIDVDEGTSTAIVTLVTALLVYFVPNEPA